MQYLRLKRYIFGFIEIFFLLLSSGCNMSKEDIQKSSYNNDIVTLGNMEVATISKIVNSQKNIVSNFVSDEVIKLVYEKNSINDEEYEKYRDYFYNECYGFTTLFGAISTDDENYIEFVKKLDNGDKVLVVLIDETVSNGDSQYSISYQIKDFDENVDEIYYNKQVTIMEDGEPTVSIIKNDRCN